ncbi:hypothetical protein J7E73_24060 [Paenibacillus albidus]|uniref:hypothetical protein n=1 Tax=Paenibacillus albidus TaxID=2041023 RepID=UPI001BE89F45|nr:hypothetical protein [Paenibacillus albidus]MBT2292152.1 hypothetical protein [Paenibacillus albidus]
MPNYKKNPVKGIPIGIIGPDALVKKMLKVIQNFPSFYPIPKVYQMEDEAPGLAETVAAEVEALILSGPMPYRRVREETRLNVYPLCASYGYGVVPGLVPVKKPARTE